MNPARDRMCAALNDRRRVKNRVTRIPLLYDYARKHSSYRQSSRNLGRSPAALVEVVHHDPDSDDDVLNLAVSFRSDGGYTRSMNQLSVRQQGCSESLWWEGGVSLRWSGYTVR